MSEIGEKRKGDKSMPGDDPKRAAEMLEACGVKKSLNFWSMILEDHSVG